MVDWSAGAVPRQGVDSIWIAVLDRATLDAPALWNPATRSEAERILDEVITERSSQRTLIGVDVPMGYPRGTAAAAQWAGSPWRAAWSFLGEHLNDDERNRNDRFEVAAAWNGVLGDAPGPFWGCTAAAARPHLTVKRPTHEALPRFRTCEERLRDRGYRPSSVWQLGGAGSVGGQAITAIPMIDRLRRRHADRIEIWPFTTGFDLPAREARPDVVVVAETWPTPFEVDLGRHAVKDAAQVLHVVTAWIEADCDGRARSWFAMPDDVSADVAEHAVVEEGWILPPPRGTSVARGGDHGVSPTAGNHRPAAGRRRAPRRRRPD